MKTRKPLMIAAAVGILAIMGGATFFYSASLTHKNGDALRKYGLIRGNMTEEQVESLIGIPPGDYCVKRQIGDFVWDDTGNPWERFRESAGNEERRQWHWDDGTISIWFDHKGNMVLKTFTPLP
jgi:hypothetical protein